MSEQTQKIRQVWGTCDDCLLTVIVEAHPDFGPGDIARDEWDRTFLECPSCGERVGDNTDPVTSWETLDDLVTREFTQRRAAKGGDRS